MEIQTILPTFLEYTQETPKGVSFFDMINGPYCKYVLLL